MRYLIVLLLITGKTYGQQTVTVVSPLSLTNDNLKADCPTTAQFNELTARVNAIPATGTVVKTITANNYVITQADNNAILLFTTACSIATSSLQAGFKCQCQQRGSTISFAGTYNSKFNYKRCQTQWGWVEVIATGNNIISLKGDLKQ